MGFLKWLLNPDTVTIIGGDRSFVVKKLGKLPVKTFSFRDRDYVIAPEGVYIGKNGSKHVVFLENNLTPIVLDSEGMSQKEITSAWMSILDHDNTIRNLSPVRSYPPMMIILAIMFSLVFGILIGIGIFPHLVR